MDNIQYRFSCLHCMDSTGESHMYQWEGFKKMINKFEPAYREFQVSYKLKIQFYNEDFKCELCGQKGIFDFWDIKVNGQPIYEKPKNETRQIHILADKIDNEITTKIDMYKGVLGMFQVPYRFIDLAPKSNFISHDGGFIDLLIYEMEDGQFGLNRFRFGGFSHNDLQNTLKSIEDHYLHN